MTCAPDARKKMNGRQALESWAKAYLQDFGGPLSTDVRTVAQPARDAAKGE